MRYLKQSSFTPVKSEYVSQLIRLIIIHFVSCACRIDFCYIQAINGTLRRDKCQEPQRQMPCHPPGIGYFVRGERLNIDLLRQRELVRSNPTLGFKTSLLFWMNSVRPVLNQGFGATIRAINGTECNGGNLAAVNERIRYYRDYCGQLGVDPGSNLSC